MMNAIIQIDFNKTKTHLAAPKRSEDGNTENSSPLMNTCWKCGRPVAEGKTECDHGCPSRLSPEDAKKFALCLERLARRRRIDWSKVQSLADVILVFSTLFSEASVDPDSAEAEKLERFLEPKKGA